MEKLDTRRIAETFFLNLEVNEGMDVRDKKSMDGYFIFDLGKDSVWHFTLKGARRWKWGLWITKGEEDGRKYKLELFAQHEDYIDKFKPSYSRIHFDLTVNMDEDKWEERLYNDDWKYIMDMRNIMRHPYLNKYVEDNEGEPLTVKEGFLSFMFKDIWYNRISYPLKHFREEKLTRYEAWLLGLVIRLRYPRIRTEVEVLGNGWIPNSILHINYRNIKDDDEVYDIYHSRTMKFTKWVRRHGWCNFNVEHFRDDEDRKGFYYTEDEK